MDSTQSTDPVVAQNSANQGAKEYQVFKDLSGDTSSSALLRVGKTRKTAEDRESAVTTWEFPVADVLDHINWAFTEALTMGDFETTSLPDSGGASASQSDAIGHDNRNPEKSSCNQIPVDDLIAHVDNLFDNPLDLLNPVLPEQKDERADSAKFLKSSSRVSIALSGKRTSSLYKVLKKFARLGKTVEQSSHGTITSLGKFILDQETESAISAIIDDGGARAARTLTAQTEESLREHLLPIENQPGVAGYMVLGYDGLIVANQLPEEMDPDSFSAWALVTYMHSQQFITAIGHKRMRQLVAKTDHGCVLLCAFGQALLLVISDNAANESIVPLLIKARNVRAA